MTGLQSLAVGGGVTAPRDGRHATGALLAVQGPTDLDIRTGVMWGPGSTALVTGTSATGPMTVQIGVHHAVTSRGTANGPYVGPTLDAATTVNIGAAPASGQSRIDVVYVKQQDGNSGVPSPDVTTAPLYGVLAGAAATTGLQVKPDLTTIVGAEELATVQVAAGATATNGSGVTITNTAKPTVARGARVPVRTQASRDALTAFPGLEVYRLDTGQVQLCTSIGPTVWETLFDGAGAGYNKRQRAWVFSRTSANASDALTPVNTMVSTVSGTIVGASAGDYHIECRQVISNLTSQAGFTRITANGTTVNAGPLDPRADTINTSRLTFFQSATYQHTGGDLTIAGLYQGAADTPSVWKQGTELVITYLGPR
jgi:hypothetical protein